MPSRGTDSKLHLRELDNADLHEARLLRLIVTGDRQAFDTLYRLYFDRLYKFLDRMTHSLATIEDIVNETMLAVWRKAEYFDGKGKVSTWIYAIAYRTALHAVKYLEEPLDLGATLSPVDELNTLDSVRSFMPPQLSIEQAMRSLPFEQRIVVSLVYDCDANYHEIAQIMACPLNVVKTRTFLARKRLRDVMGKQWGER